MTIKLQPHMCGTLFVPLGTTLLIKIPNCTYVKSCSITHGKCLLGKTFVYRNGSNNIQLYMDETDTQYCSGPFDRGGTFELPDTPESVSLIGNLLSP